MLAEVGSWWRTNPCATSAVAAIDCGTNSIRLLIAEVPTEGPLIEIVREMRIVRLGEGVDSTGEFAPDALARTFAACDEYRQLIEHHGARAVRFVATSASRDVSNRDAFIAGVRDRLGIEPEVISGTEEAELSFLGAVRGLPDLESPVLVVDIGGGSTEFVLGEYHSDVEIRAAVSVDIGCVRMFERHLLSDPATADQIAAVQADVAAAFNEAEQTVPLNKARSVVGVAGTVTTVSAMAMGLREYDPAVIHGSVLQREQIEAVTEQFLSMHSTDRSELPFMHPGRVDVIGAGSLILRELARRISPRPVIVSEYDILDGIVYRLASVSS
ncbi:MAG: Ppx/GppA phosphatase family protein [Actinomycetota bacterium]|nr:Ppx/GppA phosphatase family protein [Actinomycetota bacterium]